MTNEKIKEHVQQKILDKKIKKLTYIKHHIKDYDKKHKHHKHNVNRDKNLPKVVKHYNISFLPKNSVKDVALVALVIGVGVTSPSYLGWAILIAFLLWCS